MQFIKSVRSMILDRIEEFRDLIIVGMFIAFMLFIGVNIGRDESVAIFGNYGFGGNGETAGAVLGGLVALLGTCIAIIGAVMLANFKTEDGIYGRFDAWRETKGKLVRATVIIDIALLAAVSYVPMYYIIKHVLLNALQRVAGQ